MVEGTGDGGNKMISKLIIKLFQRRLTPAELLFQKKIDDKSSPSIDSLRRGANRQWRRIHDPDFQTKEMIETLNRIVPPKKPGSNEA